MAKGAWIDTETNRARNKLGAATRGGDPEMIAQARVIYEVLKLRDQVRVVASLDAPKARLAEVCEPLVGSLYDADRVHALRSLAPGMTFREKRRGTLLVVETVDRVAAQVRYHSNGRTGEVQVARLLGRSYEEVAPGSEDA